MITQFRTDFLDNIAVQPPYCALRDIRLEEEGRVSAQIPVEIPLDDEAGLLPAAQAFRHLAVLGACATSMNPHWSGPNYYLPVQAALRLWPSVLKTTAPDESLRALATAHFERQRIAVANVQLFDPIGDQIGALKIGYEVMPGAEFRALYGGFIHAEDPLDEHTPTRGPLFWEALDDRRLTASLGTVGARDCDGHFPGCPVVPVSVWLAALNNGCAAYAQRLQRAQHPYRITHAVVRTSDLAFAGERIDLSVELLGVVHNDYRFEAHATTPEGKQVGRLLTSLTYL